MKLSQFLLYIFLVFMVMWMCFWGYYIILDIMVDREYINYSLLLKEALGDVIYPYVIIIMSKILFARSSHKGNVIKTEKKKGGSNGK
ncbi:hypothetical protein NYR79_04805 [Actinobacillus equuli subsp. haemolyticus]|uniref:hypothetical protein n=1 Tax=Actinobacillus equuli TaxID=718 RepID=UPI0024418B3D|nr:hypothetical protein [Actinobacillus equuli]WGE72189.1 hypothetical protein NYR79_04805 [Actinobacillus equuli subsp. haemolyticus]WGE80561.1 hypothetical protein NYR66_06320 [Actinobacillus equuli subsp. haemolyticus]